MFGQVGPPRRTKSRRLQGSAQEQQTLWLRAAGDLRSVERSSMLRRARFAPISEVNGGKHRDLKRRLSYE